jgi:hypothetical protein
MKLLDPNAESRRGEEEVKKRKMLLRAKKTKNQ